MCGDREFMLENGTCEECAPFKRQAQDQLHCHSEVCNNTQKLITDGTCEDCPAKLVRSSDGKSCVKKSTFLATFLWVCFGLVTVMIAAYLCLKQFGKLASQRDIKQTSEEVEPEDLKKQDEQERQTPRQGQG